MKKIFTLFVAFAVMLCLVGCGVNITSIGLPASAELQVGETTQMTINYGTEKEADAEKIAAAAEKLELVWASSDESVATVDADGLVTAVGGGEANITVSAKDANIQSVCKVTVTVPLEGLEVTGTVNDKKGTGEFDGTVHLVINVKDSDALVVKAVPANADMTGFVFESADKDVVAVDAEGKLTAVANGETTVTVKSGEISTEVTVKVDTAPEKIVLEDVTLETGHTTKLEATFEGNNITVGKNLTWASSDEDVVVVDEDGTATAKSAGETKIIATNEFGQDYEVTVKVAEPVRKAAPANGNGGPVGERTPDQGSGVSPSTPASTPEPAPAPSTPPAPDPTPTPTPPTPDEPQHYHGNGTDEGACPVCGLLYSPTLDASTAPGYADGAGGE